MLSPYQTVFPKSRVFFAAQKIPQLGGKKRSIMYVGRRSLARETRAAKPAVGSSLREGQFVCAVTAQARLEASGCTRPFSVADSPSVSARAPPR